MHAYIHTHTQGATLHFATSAHPSLPETLASRATLSVRITHVDERAKRDLLCEGKNPLECRAVESYLSQPLSPQDKENCLLQTLQGTGDSSVVVIPLLIVLL